MSPSTKAMGRVQESRDKGETPNLNAGEGNGTTKNQTHAPHNSRRSSVHNPGTEAARAIQLSRPNVTRGLGVRLHPKACAAFGL